MLGYAGVELACSDAHTGRSRRWVEGLARRCSELEMSMAVHAPSIDLHLDSPNHGIRRESVRQIKGTLTLFSGLAQHVTIHTGYAKRFAKHGSLERLAESLGDVCAWADECGVVVAVENVYENTVDEMLTYIDLTGSQTLGFVVDAAHAHAYASLDLPTAMEVLGARVAAVHLSDNFGGDDQHLALGDGSVPLIPFLAGLDVSVPRTVEARNRVEAAQSLEFLLRKCSPKDRDIDRPGA
jgi:sugar phosphate isomerase/epimerase